MRDNDTTFVKLFRQIRERSWYRDGPAVRLYLELLMSANILYAIYGEETVRRGEVLTSYRQLSEATGLSYKSVRNGLVRLERAGMIRSRLAVGRHVITVLCYGDGVPPDPSEYLREESVHLCETGHNEPGK